MLNKELNAGLADDEVKARIVELDGTVQGGSPAEFGKIISEAAEKWTKAIKFAGIKAEQARFHWILRDAQGAPSRR